MKRIINLALLIVCLTAICKTGKAQQANKQSNATDVPAKVTALKALPPAKPIVPGGEIKSAEAFALPAGKASVAPADRTVIPNPALNMPVNTIPAIAEAKQAAVIKQEPAVQAPATQHN